MKTVEEVYKLFDEVGCCSFATLDGAGGVDARIAHFFAFDEDGLYLRTMRVKPFYRQLKLGWLAVSAEHTTGRLGRRQHAAFSTWIHGACGGQRPRAHPSGGRC